MKLTRVIEAIGMPDFERTLLDILHDAVGAEHLSTFLFQTDLFPIVALAASLDGSDLARRAGEAYIHRNLYLGDPMRGTLRPRMLEANPALHIIIDSPGNRNQSRKSFFDRFELGERITILGHVRLGWMSLSLYRAQDARPIEVDALAEIETCAPIYHSSTARHLELSKQTIGYIDPVALFSERLSKKGKGLTPREMEVCLAALQGKTNAEIGIALGVRTNTVGTLRRRAYERLNVSNLAELFLICLEAKV